MSTIHVIHENDAWVEPLRDAFRADGLPFREWFMGSGALPLDVPPPEGVFYNRMSASSHTRGHRFAPEATAVLLAQLERHGRRVVNGSRALQLEVSKAAQYAALDAAGIVTPRTIAAVGREALVEAARRLDPPFLVKPNRGGTGRGVQRFDSREALKRFLSVDALEESPDGITLLQQYIEAPEPFITRVEFVGGEFLYAVRVDTGGSFALCPADACVEDGPAPSFTIHDRVDRSLIDRYETVLRQNGIEVAAIEYVLDANGDPWTYDLNTNTNYNTAAESVAQKHGMRAIARFLGSELAALEDRHAA